MLSEILLKPDGEKPVAVNFVYNTLSIFYPLDPDPLTCGRDPGRSWRPVLPASISLDINIKKLQFVI
jgi:hypothetical protein